MDEKPPNHLGLLGLAVILVVGLVAIGLLLVQ